MKKIVVLLVMISVGFTYAQEERTLKLNKEKDLIEVIYYHDNGEVSQTGYYNIDGKLHGEWLSFSQEGKKMVSAKYENGKKVGKWFYWIGSTLKEVDYFDNAIANVNEWTNSKTIVASSE